MGKSVLFTSWAGLLALALYFAWATHDLRSSGRTVVATVIATKGKVYQRPANISVYEPITFNDHLFDGDYISTGAGSTAELHLASGKTLLVSENSMILLTSDDGAGLGADIVTLLKGDIVARGGGAAKQRTIRFKVAGNTVSDIDSNAGVRISRQVEGAEATIRVTNGIARVLDEKSNEQQLRKDGLVKLAAAAPARFDVSTVQAGDLAAVPLPTIKANPQAILANDKLVANLPRTLGKVDFAKLAPIDTAFAQPPKFETPMPVLAPVKSKPVFPQKTTPSSVAPKVTPKVAVVTPKPANPQMPAKPVAPPFEVILQKDNPSVFSGTSFYVVRNGRLYAKITGKPTTEDLLSLNRRLGGQFIFKGRAEAFAGAASLEALSGKKLIYVAGAQGMQQLDATLIRSRPVALELLVNGGYMVFQEKVDVINVGH